MGKPIGWNQIAAAHQKIVLQRIPEGLKETKIDIKVFFIKILEADYAINQYRKYAQYGSLYSNRA